jgi:transcriptional regulator with XRE-family HTH domain
VVTAHDGDVRGDLRKLVGKRVRERRMEVLKISQEALAERASLHRNYVGGVERGERDIGVVALGQLVNALGMSLAEFFAPFRSRGRHD